MGRNRTAWIGDLEGVKGLPFGAEVRIGTLYEPGSMRMVRKSGDATLLGGVRSGATTSVSTRSFIPAKRLLE